MEKIFNPDSLVVIGVSEHPNNLARNIVENLLDFKWPGKLYLYGKESGHFHGLKIHADMNELPENIDLAVILTPAKTVPGLLRRCIARGISRVVIESGGFSEFSDAGKALEDEILALAELHQVKYVGPNGISIINRHNGLCLPFMRLAPDEIRTGGLSVISQSGGLALTYIGLGRRENIGVAKIISMGNKSSLDEVDYLEFLARDPETRVIGLYLESMAKGRQFLKTLAGCSKPVVLHKANTAPESRVIAQSHTAALAVDDEIVDAACRQSGIFRAKSFQQFINLAKAFALPSMRGNRLMIISRSGGHAVVSADAAAANGFRLPPLADDFVEKISSQFRAAVIKPTNPLDLGDIFNIDYYITILELSLKREDVDGVILNHVFQAESEAAATRRLCREVESLSRRYDKPVGLVLFSSQAAVAALMTELELPVFSEPLLAIEALAASRQRHEHLSRPGEEKPLPRPLSPGALPLYNEWLVTAARRDLTLFADQALSLVTEYGLPATDWALARDYRELLEEGQELGFPLVLKAVVAGMSHKSDAGGVLTGVHDLRALEDVGELLFKRFAENTAFCGVLLQKEVDTRLEMIVGIRRDASFGDVFLLGLGGSTRKY